MRIRHIATIAIFSLGLFIGLYFFSQGLDSKTDLPKENSFTTVAFNEGNENEAANPSKIEDYSDRNFGQPAGFELPSTMSVHDFEKVLYKFLENRQYQDLGWAKDKGIRDTGPYINKKSYGTHPAVRVFYSPEVMGWLINGRKGTIPDGAVIIKEQYEEPAARHAGKNEDELRDSLKSWTVMIKDSNGSHDGWFWSNPYPTKEKGGEVVVVDNHKYPFNHPESGFGHYCLRCHAATQSPDIEDPAINNEFTFSSLRNIEGFPKEPLIFRVDDSWRDEEHNKTETVGTHPSCADSGNPEICKLKYNKEFGDTYDQIGKIDFESSTVGQSIRKIPPVTHDWVVKGAEGKQDLVTSNQCMGCHAGLAEPYGPTMFVGYEKDKVGYKDPGWHISPYGEWRWTPMGLAGRDPVFYSQLESEIEMLKKEFDPETAKKIGDTLQNTCLRCHGAMGKHQFDHDKQDKDDLFSIEHMYLTAKDNSKSPHLGHGESKYGALGRDGISCMVCHRSVKPEQPVDDDRPYLKYFLENAITGNFKLGPPNELYGPYKDDEISPYVMHHGTGIKPKYNSYIQESRMCGTCHAVSLPVVDHPFGEEGPSPHQQELVDGENVALFKKFYHHIEQATYLEWLNSEYQDELGDNIDRSKVKSCQECHMSKDLPDAGLEKISTRIAVVQDTTYPDAENLTSHHNLEVRMRDEGTYNRHNFVGLNVFLVELFRQHDNVLGVRKNDFMTGSKKDIEHAIKNYQRQAEEDTVDISLETEVSGRTLTASVDITNKTGHRFPSGVGFRRAFIELQVMEKRADGTPKLVWSSGRTNSLGIIVGADNQPLKSEFFEVVDGEQVYQRHHQEITSEDQVQIYETLLHTYHGEFTTSFIRGNTTIKDNRFLPKGWTEDGPDKTALSGNYLKATHPGESAKKDSRYQDGSGTDETIYKIELPEGVNRDNVTVTAKLFYQAFPPYFLKNLFDTAPDGEATKRLHFMLNYTVVEDTPIEDWKFQVGKTIEQRVSNR